MANRVAIRVTADDDATSVFARIRGAASAMTNSIGGSFASLSGHAKLTVAAILAIFIALPAALAVIGALLVPAIAGGFIAIAALAFKSNSEVKTAFADMKESVVVSVREAAAPMKSALVAGMNEVGRSAIAMKPILTEVFAGAAELTVPLARALGDFVHSLMPGFKAALTGSVPVINGMRDGLVSIGTGLSNMIRLMTSNKEGLADVWRELGRGVENLLTTIGELTQFLIESGTAAQSLRIIFDALTLSVKILEGAYKVMNLGLDQNSSAMTNHRDAVSANREALGRLFSMDFKGFYKFLFNKEEYENWKTNMSEGTELQGLLGESITGMAGTAKTGAAAVQELVNQFYELNRATLSAMETEAAMHEAIFKLDEAVRKHTGSLKLKNGEVDLSDRKTRQLLKPMFDLAGKTLGAAAAAEKNGKSWSVQRGLMDQGRKALIRAGERMGITRGQASRLADAILGIPSNKHVHFTSNAGAIAAQIRSAQQSISDSMARMRASGGILSGRAHGGVVGHAATGGVRSNMTMVGEHGPELVDLPPGSHVRSNPDTRRTLGGMGGGGGPVVIHLSIGGRDFGDVIVDAARKTVATRGGNVQAVIGQRGA
jgi:hypothetical protein